jgi:hypothetical protein
MWQIHNNNKKMVETSANDALIFKQYYTSYEYPALAPQLHKHTTSRQVHVMRPPLLDVVRALLGFQQLSVRLQQLPRMLHNQLVLGAVLHDEKYIIIRLLAYVDNVESILNMYCKRGEV